MGTVCLVRRCRAKISTLQWGGGGIFWLEGSLVLPASVGMGMRVLPTLTGYNQLKLSQPLCTECAEMVMHSEGKAHAV